MVFFQILEDLFLLFNLSCVVFGLLVGDLYLELVVFELLLLSFDLDAKVKEFFLKAGLVLLQVGLLGLL